jgi:hypothetical protein
MLEPTPGQHHLLVEANGEATHGKCSCGLWERDAGADTVAVTGKSREDVLRSAHELHSRGIVAP